MYTTLLIFGSRLSQFNNSFDMLDTFTIHSQVVTVSLQGSYLPNGKDI